MLIELYSKDNCSYCNRAKALLIQAQIPFVEKKLGFDFTREHLLEQYPTAESFPVVVIDGWYIGGAEQLSERVTNFMSRSLALSKFWLINFSVPFPGFK